MKHGVIAIVKKDVRFLSMWDGLSRPAIKQDYRQLLYVPLKSKARKLIGVLAWNLRHMLRQFYVMGEEAKQSREWLIKRLIKVGAKVAYHGRRWQVRVVSAFPLARHYRAVFG